MNFFGQRDHNVSEQYGSDDCGLNAAAFKLSIAGIGELFFKSTRDRNQIVQSRCRILF